MLGSNRRKDLYETLPRVRARLHTLESAYENVDPIYNDGRVDTCTRDVFPLSQCLSVLNVPLSGSDDPRPPKTISEK